MLGYKLPIHVTGLAMAILAGISLAAPVHAQTIDDSRSYQDGRSYSDSPSYSDRSVDDTDSATDDDANAGDDDDQPTVTAGTESDDNRRVDDGQDFARSDEERRCMTEFQTFDPATGMYVTADGDRERCPYLF